MVIDDAFVCAECDRLCSGDEVEIEFDNEECWCRDCFVTALYDPNVFDPECCVDVYEESSYL